MIVGEIIIAERNGAEVGEIADRDHQLGDAAGDNGGREIGPSLVPIMVMVTVCVAVPPKPSLTLTV